VLLSTEFFLFWIIFAYSFCRSWHIGWDRCSFRWLCSRWVNFYYYAPLWFYNLYVLWMVFFWSTFWFVWLLHAFFSSFSGSLLSFCFFNLCTFPRFLLDFFLLFQVSVFYWWAWFLSWVASLRRRFSAALKKEEAREDAIYILCKRFIIGTHNVYIVSKRRIRIWNPNALDAIIVSKIRLRIWNTDALDDIEIVSKQWIWIWTTSKFYIVSKQRIRIWSSEPLMLWILYIVK
jgi:hypothetical protein